MEFCLPPHTIHKSQPLDISVFQSLKQNWQAVCHTYMQSNPTMTITKYQFSGLLKQAWGKTMVPTTIYAGFHKCGVYPFNLDAIDCSLSVAKPKPDKAGPSTVSNPADAFNFEQPRGEAMISQKWPAEKVAL